MRIFRAFSTIPALVRWAAIATVGLFVLAVVVGFFNRSSPAPAVVSVVAPAASPGQLSAAAPPQAAAPAPHMGGGTPMAPAGAIMRPARMIDAGAGFADCARETLALPENTAAFNLESVRFLAAATRDECQTPTLSVSPDLPDSFAPFVPVRNRGYIQITRSGLFSAPSSGEYTLTIVGGAGKQARCALYVGDMSVPVLQGEDHHGRFGGVATVGLEAGRHEVALACGFALLGGAATGGVTVSIRAPGEAMPRLVTLQTARTPAASATLATPVQEPAK